MAYEYAVVETIKLDTPDMHGEDGWEDYPTETETYHSVPKEVAETHPDGRWRLVSAHGTDMTGWQWFRNFVPDSDYGKGKPLPDAAGQMLAVYDLVMTTIRSGTKLYVCEVVRFTPKKIFVNYNGSEESKFPYEIIKVDKALFA